VNLDGIFKVLPNVCWTSLGPVTVSEIVAVQQWALARGIHLDVRSVDKFPPMLDYVIPTVMHEGFVNFNARTPAPPPGVVPDDQESAELDQVTLISRLLEGTPKAIIRDYTVNG